MGIYDKSAVVVVSDHGDQFYEHGSVGHGDTVYQELAHVPLIIRAPGVLPAGQGRARRRRDDGHVRDAARSGGRQADAETPGDRRWCRWRSTRWAARPRAALTVDGQVRAGSRSQRYRLVHRGPGRIELYDEFDDPREQKDVAADHPIALRGMRGVLGLLYAYETTWSKARWGTAANVTEAFYAAAGPPGRRGAEPKSGRTEVAEIAGCPRAARTHVRGVIPENTETLVDDDEAAYAPESGQPRGGRENPWDDDDEKSAGAHAFPAEHHESPKDEF